MDGTVSLILKYTLDFRILCRLYKGIIFKLHYILNSAFPASPGPLVDFIKKVSSFYHQQRKLTHPVVVHCVPGVGKTGVFCVLAAAMEEIIKGNEIPDVTQVRIRNHLNDDMRLL